MSLIGVIASQQQVFVPSDIPNLVEWLDADDPSTIIQDDLLGFVSEWLDKSGVGNDVEQTTGSMQPTTGVNVSPSGKNAIAFNGANDFMTLASFSTTPDITMLIATKIITSDNINDSILNMNGTGTFQIQATVSGAFRATFTASDLGETTPPGAPSSIEGIPSLLNYRLSNNDSDVIFRLDGVQVSTDTYDGGLGTPQPLSLGRNRVGNHRVEADIYEILIYNRDLTLSEMMAAENYLINKWGI
ncbi:MAG: hypothetical protein KAV87_12975 [Desulfobacteraceae bacterium]|nr:hypothetical protein [Desulfobacteraceae bacterium]